jgi:hypothetical protein
MRESLTNTFKSYYPLGTILALNWAIEALPLAQVLDITTKRVILRFILY